MLTPLRERRRSKKLSCSAIKVHENYADLIEDVLDELSDIFNYDQPKANTGFLYFLLSSVKSREETTQNPTERTISAGAMI